MEHWDIRYWKNPHRRASRLRREPSRVSGARERGSRSAAVLGGLAHYGGPAGHTGVDDPDGVENLRGIADRGVPRSGDLEVRRYSDDRIHRSE